ncbi:ORF6N domain-containing protein (plasmid) [Halomonas qaidamensis]|uniref:ORF6N domain-containing protein n=2 Tax=Halomonas qaidamensis TaxID=2866211 RepID=A0ABY6JYY4_9GAMM|nr:ORF6N domain-containing protein [Halomonas qaidamensis]
MPTVSVSGVALPYIEFQGQPVVTFAMIDAAHSRPERTARRSFSANKRHFIEDEDFYRVDFKRWHEFRATYSDIFPESTTRLTLFTETGYLMLVKSFTDDLAWQVQRQLVKSYFRVKGAMQPTAAEPIPTPIDHRQREQLANAANAVFQNFNGMRQSATGWFYNSVRTEYCLKRIEDLSADDLPAVLDRLQSLRHNVRQYEDFRRDMQQSFLKEVVGEGMPYTAWVSKMAGGQHHIGKRPDWKAIAKQVLINNGLLAKQ